MSRAVPLAVSVLLVGVAATGCSGSPQAAGPPPSPSPSATVSTTPSVGATPTPARTTNPLSGTKSNINGQVLVVKIDNTVRAHPQRGVAEADVVYIEPVEYGLTRLAAVYSSRVPDEVGPVRSARESDLELVRQYGTLAFAYSGARKLVLKQIAKAPIYDLSELTAPAGFRRSSTRPMPYNLYARPDRLLGLVPKAARAGDVGFRFDAAAPGGRPAQAVTARWTRARATFTWSAADRRWVWDMDGRAIRDDAGRRIAATNVIVQYVDAPLSSYTDFLGARTPLPRTVGTGAALVLRDGRAYYARWNRPRADVGTRWTVGGADLPLAPGQTWIVLLDRRTPASLR